MARKRERLSSADGQRLFTQRLSTLLGKGNRPRNAALDLLTGGPAEAPEQQETPPEPAPRRVRERQAEKPVERKRLYVARTVYLESGDLEEVDALAKEWSKLAQRRVSRSEVLRQAIRWLRGGAVTPPFGPGESNG